MPILLKGIPSSFCLILEHLLSAHASVYQTLLKSFMDNSYCILMLIIHRR